MKRTMRCVLLTMLLLSTALVHAQSVTRSTFNILTRVQEMMDSGQVAEARIELEQLIVDKQGIPYDFAIANQYLAHASVLLGDTERARDALKTALEVEELPPQARIDMNLFYGTVLLGEGEYEQARVILELWYESSPAPNPSQIFSTAYANYMSGKIERAEELLLKALSLAPGFNESWNQLHYQILFDLRRYAEAETVLRGMLYRNPENGAYWRILVSHYMQLEDNSKALAAFMVANQNGLIDQESDLGQIVNLYGYIDVPEKGARLLENWIEEGKLEKDADSLKQLGELWLLAREREQAMTVLQQAAELAPDGRTYQLLGGIFFEDEQWADAYIAYGNALRVGDLTDPARISLLAGISAFRAGNKADARRALEVAAESDEFRAQAESLLRQLDRS